MYYIGIYSRGGKVGVTLVYNNLFNLHQHVHRSNLLLKVCECPVKKGLNPLVKKALRNYRPLPGLT